jgi:hypothetical protein
MIKRGEGKEEGWELLKDSTNRTTKMRTRGMRGRAAEIGSEPIIKVGMGRRKEAH